MITKDPVERRKSLAQALRKRKKMQFTLSDSARRRIKTLAKGGDMSRVIDNLILSK